ncbi:hypothetical protein L3V77_24330 [Vibrio sp. DW001]|uniref:hypothetical protein n=1 Tax=Vibrio sp. DW001 TaxID=2912315 RepID=UPI0023B176C8|nr:hypothetical protein [Vibrio sp. DW001]WED29061.1 hypothetical protein L3V77_24330 [Vibrio sp. DW001]
MKRWLIVFSAVTLGLFTLVFSLLVAIPITIAALITGRKLQKDRKKARFDTGQENVIEGEYQDVSVK